MPHSESGFTLIELLVTISILAILATIAVPSFSDFFIRNRISGVASELQASLNLARSEAARRGQPVTVCRSNEDGTNCGDDDWEENGWIVFVNEDNDGTGGVSVNVDAGEVILQVKQNLPTGVTVRPNNNFANFVTFSRTGQANQIVTFAVCVGSDETRARAITVIRTRIVMATDGNGNGIPEKSEGGALADITSCENP